MGSDLYRPLMGGTESCRGMTTHDIPPHTSTFAARRLASLGYSLGIAPESTRLPTATRLWLDWDAIARSRRDIRRANSWNLPGEPVRHLDEVLRRAGYGESMTDEGCDLYLSQLTAIAHHDELACRVVVQRILPGLIAVAVRRGRIVQGGPSFALDQLASSAWMVIRNYPIDRRPLRVAANLLRDIEYQAFVRESRTKRNSVELPADTWTIVNGETLRATRGIPMRGASSVATEADPVGSVSEQRISRDSIPAFTRFTISVSANTPHLAATLCRRSGSYFTRHASAEGIPILIRHLSIVAPVPLAHLSFMEHTGILFPVAASSWNTMILASCPPSSTTLPTSGCIRSTASVTAFTS